MSARMLQMAWIGLVVVSVCYYFWHNWSVFRNYDWQLDLSWLLVAVFWAMGRRLLGGIRWVLIVLCSDQGKAAGSSSTAQLRVYFQSNLARYIPGSVWYIPSRIALGTLQGVGAVRTSVGLALEIGLNVWSGLLLGAYAALFFLPINDLAFVTLLVLLVLLSLLVIQPRIMDHLLNLGLRIVRRPTAQIDISLRWAVQVGLISLAIWVAGGLSQFYLLKALYPTVGLRDLPGITSAVALAWTIGLLVPWAPQGLGVRDGLLVALLQVYVPLPVAVAATVASRLLVVVEDVAWATAATLLW